MQWFRLYNEWAHDPKVQMLDYATQRHLVMLFCMHSEGLIDETTSNEEVAFYLRVSVTEVETLHETLHARFLETNTWIITAWNERQKASDNSMERVRKYRENKRNPEKRFGNVTVTPLIEREKERKKEKTTKKESATPTAGANAATPDGFAEFWNLYPRKVAKGAAEKAFEKAAKKTTPSEITAGLRRYVRQVADKEPEFIAHAATWLNQRRWEDETTTQAGGKGHDIAWSEGAYS